MKTMVDGVMQTLAEPAAETLEARVARLEDERAIKEVICHYARCVDLQDAAGVASIFTEDGAFCGPVMDPLKGKANIQKVYTYLLGKLNSSTHMVGNEQVLFTGADSAILYCCFIAWEGFHEALVPDDRFTMGRYELDLVREADGEWRARALYVSFAGQTGSDRFAEQLGEPWPPEPLPRG